MAVCKCYTCLELQKKPSAEVAQSWNFSVWICCEINLSCTIWIVFSLQSSFNGRVYKGWGEMMPSAVQTKPSHLLSSYAPLQVTSTHAVQVRLHKGDNNWITMTGTFWYRNISIDSGYCQKLNWIANSYNNKKGSKERVVTESHTAG